jgi:hypothetical protein
MPPSDVETLRTVLTRHRVPAETLAPLVRTDRGAVHRLLAAGTAAIPSWETLRSLVHQTGHWPVVLGDSESWGGPPDDPAYLTTLFDDLVAAAEPSATILGAGLAMEPSGWLAERAGLLRLRVAEIGTWPPAEAVPDEDYSVSGRRWVAIGLVPTLRPWELPAILPFGGWNDCPAAPEHVSMLRSWHERFAAEPVCVAGDVIELRALRPPTERASALALAREQYAYAPDIVEQGTETIEALAACLLRSTYWFFWWD